MSSGNPVVFGLAKEGRTFAALTQTSTKADDPNSFGEDVLQSLIDARPDVLPVQDFLPAATSLFSLGREIPVDIGGSEGFIDNLLVTSDGYLVIGPSVRFV